VAGVAQSTGGGAVVQALKAAGVDTVFGIISVHMLPIYDALSAEPSIRLVVPRHEQGAAFMADGYARTTGRPGVYFTSTGPGAFNSACAVHEAWVASSPTLQITGNIDTPYLDRGKGFLHEANNQQGVFRELGATTNRVVKVEEIPYAVREAFNRMGSGRPRPEFIEIPIDIQYATGDAEVIPPDPPLRPAPDPTAVERAAAVLATARRPAIWAGGGVNRSDASGALRRVAEVLGAPVVTTTAGRGAIADDHPLAVGGWSGDRDVKAFLGEADLLLVVGSRLAGQMTGNWTLTLPEQLVQIDIDPEEIGRNYPAAVGIVADGAMALDALADVLVSSAIRPWADGPETARRLREGARANVQNRMAPLAGLLNTVRAAIPRDAILVTDATIMGYFGANNYFPLYEPRTHVGPQSVAIGPGLPLGIGAKIGNPDREVVVFAGDGGFMLTATEMATAAQYNVPVRILLFNNGGYGILRRMQKQQFDGRHIGVELRQPDFVQFAEALGVRGLRVNQPEALPATLVEAMETPGPVLVDVELPDELS
jgi:acetolactate synthase-1/2/3 large subunit